MRALQFIERPFQAQGAGRQHGVWAYHNQPRSSQLCMKCTNTRLRLLAHLRTCPMRKHRCKFVATTRRRERTSTHSPSPPAHCPAPAAVAATHMPGAPGPARRASARTAPVGW